MNITNKAILRLLGVSMTHEDLLTLILLVQQLDGSSGPHITEKQLRYLEVKSSELWSSFRIPKRGGGSRRIESPDPFLLLIQRRIKRIIEATYCPLECVHGFVEGRSVVTNATPHVNKRYVIKFDINNFFPSISKDRFVELMQEKGLATREFATLLSRYCFYKEKLPQGGATSPVISNIVFLNTDMLLLEMARELDLTYTRYSDDLTFSSNHYVRMGALTKRVSGLLSDSGFVINRKKTRFLRKSDRQKVTGVITNEKLSVDRRYINNLRAIIHNYQHRSRDELMRQFAAQGYGAGKSIEQVISGKLNYLSMVRGACDPIYMRLRAKYEMCKGRFSEN